MTVHKPSEEEIILGGYYNYFGRKDQNDMNATRGLMPEGKFSRCIDGFFGSGAMTIGLFSEYKRVKLTGVDKNKALMAMHRMVRDRPIAVMDAVKELEYSLECYEECIRLLKQYEKEGGVDEAKVAAAKYAVLYMSRNSMEGIYRKIGKMGDKFLSEADERFFWNKRIGLHNKIYDIVPHTTNILSNVELLCDDIMEHSEFWEDEETFLYLDVPYPLEGRGIKEGMEPQKNTGYATDWTKGDQLQFLNFVTDMHEEEKLKAKVMICGNISLDEADNLKNLDASLYNKMLLPLGFRMVVTQKKHTCEQGKNAAGKRKRKAEVVWINYTEIASLWNGREYYDYDDVF